MSPAAPRSRRQRQRATKSNHVARWLFIDLGVHFFLRAPEHHFTTEPNAPQTHISDDGGGGVLEMTVYVPRPSDTVFWLPNGPVGGRHTYIYTYLFELRIMSVIYTKAAAKETQIVNKTL